MPNDIFFTDLQKWSKFIVGNLRSKVRQKNMISIHSKDSRKIIGNEKIMKSDRLLSVEYVFYSTKVERSVIRDVATLR